MIGPTIPGAISPEQLGEFILNPDCGLLYDFTSKLYYHPKDNWCVTSFFHFNLRGAPTYGG